MRTDTIRRRWSEKLKFLLSLELGSNSLCSLLTLAPLLPPPKQITYPYLNRKARRSGDVFVIVVFSKCIYFFPSVFIF